MIARARWSESGLALLGSVVALWPLTTLLEGGSWLWALLVLCAFVGLVGAGMRTTRASAGGVLAVQVLALVAVVLLLNVHDHLDSTLISAIQDLVQEAHDTVRQSSVPAPVTPGLLMMLELIVPGLAIGTDFLAVTARQPALAGVPMMVIYMLSTSNSGAALNPVFFILLAVAWLTMLAHGSGVLVRSWSSVRARALTPTLHEDQLGLTGLASAARALGIATIALALIVPVFLPHPDPHYFAKGLGRGGSGGSGVVAFSTTVNLAKDLRKTDGSPVLTFKTTDLSPPPLRVTAGGIYSDGEWKDFPGPSGLIMGTDGKPLPPPAGAARTDSAYVEHLQVTDNTMTAPNVPVPFPIESGDFGQTKWGYSPTTQQPYVTRSVKSYELDYRIPQQDAYQPGRRIDRQQFGSTLQVDPKSAARVRALAGRLGGKNSFDQAVRIQDYLRSGDFVYSLTLAPTQRVDGKKLDPLSNFLVTKKGYCTQFATAMIMLARADGIPARMALGFLPGNPAANDTYTVMQSSAHAWPELYLPGMGWTRFEPTPGDRTGAPPSYTTAVTGPAGGGHAPSAKSTAPKSSSAAPSSSSAAPSRSTAARTAAGGQHIDWWGNLVIALLVLAVGLLGALVLPLLARRQRESISARLREHRPVEAQWQVLQSRLGDLGIPPPQEERSPRATERYYRSRAALPPAGLEALHSAMSTLEQERYAAPGTSPSTIDRQSRLILDGVRRQQSWPQRIAAAVLPASGRAVFRRGVARIARGPARLFGIHRRR
ncbi:transglutaminase family protein [Flexivirga sp.]|uniref:transglutaminase family protein n=1 Tax=Flexivirga sp. TaxID=1962927 RepID=UPI003F7D53B3